MEENQRKLRPYHGLILLVVCAVQLFIISPFITARLGLYGSFIGEMILLGLAVLTVKISGAELRDAFPLRKPGISKCVGTMLLWLGAFLLIMILTLLISVMYPTEMAQTSTGLGEAFTSVPFLISFLFVAITPAICEEAVFRGVVVHSMSGWNRWVVIVLTGSIFGAFHGSIWRFLPTALLGMVMAYIVMETDNMFYNGLFHCLNNALPVVLLYATQSMYAGMNNSASEYAQTMISTSATYLIAAGFYMMLSAIAPFCIYVGNYLIHRGNAGYREILFPSGKPWIIVLLIVLTILLFVGGIMIIVFAFFMEPETIDTIHQLAMM